MAVRILFYLVLLALVFARVGMAQTEAEAKRLVVLLEANLAGNAVFGAGLLLPVTNGSDKSYIVVTANHLVRQGLSEASEITVRPSFATGQHFAARLTPDFDDGLDLAVLEVIGFSPPEVRFSVMTDRLPDGSNLRTIGQGGRAGVPNIPQTRSVLSYMDSADVFLESSYIFQGDSGGGIFTDTWQLLGMLTYTDQVTKRGLPLSRILEKLERWNYKVDFSSAPVTQLSQSLQVSGYTVPGICVTAGDTLQVEATGSIIVGSVLGTAFPDGIDMIFTDIYDLIPSFPHGALLCRLDSESFWRKCGSRALFEAEKQGCLEFEINDNEQENNQGAFEVQVVVGGQ
jgi:hypothetical protein